MTKIRKDFLGLYVVANGYIARPIEIDNLQEGDEVKARHRGQTQTVILTLPNNFKIYWKTTLSSLEYQRCKKYLSQQEFEKFVIISSAYALVGNLIYPQLILWHKKTYIDFTDEKVKEDYAWAKSIQKKCADYFIKNDL